MDALAVGKLPENAERDAWQSLVASLYPLNRVHNGPEFERAIDAICSWVRAHGFGGISCVRTYPAGGEFNWWKVPQRWTVNDFELVGPDGTTITKLGDHPLALTPFSCSFDGELSKQELLSHLHTRADLPDALPFVFRRMYRHWDKGWGFAIPYATFSKLTDGTYRVRIRTEFTDEPLQLFEYRSRGSSDYEIQIAAHLDHPGQANDGVSGVVGALVAVKEFERRHPHSTFTVSVVAVPEIVGTSVYLSQDEATRARLRYALCPNMLGHDAPIAICMSRGGDSQLDRALQLAALSRKSDHVLGEWHKYPDCGDEISYDAPGYDIPASTVSRIGEMFKFYHSSDDTSATIDPIRFEEASMLMADALSIMERNAIPRATFSGLPSLANPKLDLYLEPSNMNNLFNASGSGLLSDIRTGEPLDARLFQEFFLANVGGNASLVDIAFEYGAPFDFVCNYAEAFSRKSLVELQRPVCDSDYIRSIVRTARTRSGKLPTSPS